MKEEAYGYIYKTTFPNGKIYVGQSHKNVEFNPKYHGSGIIVVKFLKTHNENELKTELIEWCYSKEELDTKEIYWIKELNTLIPNGYNISEGGEGGNLGEAVNIKFKELNKTNRMHEKHHTEETKKKMSEKAKNRDYSYISNYIWITNGENNKKILKNSEIPEGYWEGRTVSQKTLEKIRNAAKIKSDETKKRKQKEREQKELKKYGIIGLSNSEKIRIGGKKYRQALSEEERRKKYGRPKTEEEKRKIAERMKGNKYRLNIPHSEEDKEKIRKAAVRDDGQRRKWWNNGINETTAFECPNGYVEGRIKFKRNNK